MNLSKSERLEQFIRFMETNPSCSIPQASARLTADFGKGFSQTVLKGWAKSLGVDSRTLGRGIREDFIEFFVVEKLGVRQAVDKFNEKNPGSELSTRRAYYWLKEDGIATKWKK